MRIEEAYMSWSEIWMEAQSMADAIGKAVLGCFLISLPIGVLVMVVWNFFIASHFNIPTITIWIGIMSSFIIKLLCSTHYVISEDSSEKK